MNQSMVWSALKSTMERIGVGASTSSDNNKATTINPAPVRAGNSSHHLKDEGDFGDSLRYHTFGNMNGNSKARRKRVQNRGQFEAPSVLKVKWVKTLTEYGFPDEAVIDRYSEALSKHCITYQKGVKLTEAEFHEISILIGHRDDIKEAAGNGLREEEDARHRQDDREEGDNSDVGGGSDDELLPGADAPAASRVDVEDQQHQQQARSKSFTLSPRHPMEPLVSFVLAPQSQGTLNVGDEHPNHVLGGSNGNEWTPTTSAMQPQKKYRSDQVDGDKDDVESNSTVPRQQLHQQLAHSPAGTADLLHQWGQSATSSPGREPEAGAESEISSSLVFAERRNKVGVTWKAISGSTTSYVRFMDSMRELCHHYDLPETFERAFYNNKPMPFYLCNEGGTTNRNMLHHLVLLRIPDLENESGSTVATISNRLVIIFSPRLKRVVTYHRCDRDPLATLASDWDGNMLETTNVYHVMDIIFKCFLQTYRAGLKKLQETSDSLEEESDMVRVVEELTHIQKKGAVYKRCLSAGREALEELLDLRGLEAHMPLVCDTCRSFESMMDEVCENAVGTINMQMALDGFHSSRNTKVFTYISLLCQPITVATGWYGMNYINMPELEDENGYFIFAAATLTIALGLVVASVYFIEWHKRE